MSGTKKAESREHFELHNMICWNYACTRSWNLCNLSFATHSPAIYMHSQSRVDWFKQRSRQSINSLNNLIICDMICWCLTLTHKIMCVDFNNIDFHMETREVHSIHHSLSFSFLIMNMSWEMDFFEGHLITKGKGNCMRISITMRWWRWYGNDDVIYISNFSTSFVDVSQVHCDLLFVRPPWDGVDTSREENIQ